MSDAKPPSTLRELRGHIANPTTAFALGAVAAILTLVGPFGTDESLTAGFRALYWLVMVVATYVVGYGVDTLLRPRLEHRVAQVVNPLAMGAVVTLSVIVVNLLLIGRLPGGRGWFPDVLTIFAIAVLVSAAMQAIITSLYKRQGMASAVVDPPAILDRIPLEKRGALVALSVEDHYVRVRTTKGEHMILMRLSDAIRETAPAPGLRVHRSHWVATDQVTTARRDGDRAILSMTTGDDIPVSRSHIQAVKEAGLLPR